MACISITLGGASCIPLSCPGVGWSTNDIYYLRYDNVIEPERTVPSEPLSLKVKEVLDVAWITTSPFVAGVAEAAGWITGVTITGEVKVLLVSV